tara:strand:+ start:406 stop:711 length:306 start_codon:yes stop_codon:yes gene_type:complete
MVQYILELKDYKEYFCENTEIKDEEECIFLTIEPIDNKDDEEWEYSINWFNQDNDEKGTIKGINTSSYFSLNSCSWVDYDEEEEEEEEVIENESKKQKTKD